MAAKTKVTALASCRAQNRFETLDVQTLTDEEADSVIQLAVALLEHRHRPGQVIDSPKAITELLMLKYAGALSEVFGTVYLDNRHRVLSIDEPFHGTIDGASVHPRIIVQRALSFEINAAAVILFHNHPSGVAEPSSADERITRRIQDALALIDIRVLDHIVVGSEGTVSMAERGLL